MRIITGKYRGRILTTVKDLSVRPATDRVKSTIYNTLQTRLGMEGIRVLDLFAGSGSLGFEALSRGADEAVFVESNPRVLDLIRENAAKLGCTDSCSFIRFDAEDYLRSAQGEFDLIFVDPPYADESTAGFPAIIAERSLLAAGGYCLIEHTKKTVFPVPPPYPVAVVKEFGATIVTFFTNPS
jgi:16S rRNA (guanine966-N2)-methyltransferase